MEEAIVVNKGEDLIDLPPGFRFHPTDEEIITCYLTEKVVNSNFSASAIGEADLNKCEPWDLPKKAKMGEKEWYFFCQRDRKYPTGMRTNRATESGYWKATGKDKEIYKGKGRLVGMKKTLVFYKGRAPKGEKSNWVMHEYRLEGKFAYYNLPRAAKDEWVVCRVFHKNSSTGIRKSSAPEELLRMNSFGDDLLDCSSLPPLMDPPFNANPAYFSMRENNQHDQKIIFQLPTNNIYQNSNPNPSSSLYPQTPTSFSFDPNPNPAAGYNLHQGYGFGVGDHQQQGTTGSGLERQCKVEQFSSNNQSMLSRSQDTGLSTDMNAEISSVVSKQDIVGSNRSYHDHLHQGPSNIGPIADLDCLWDY